MKLVQMLPYERRIPLAGRLVARAAPMIGFTRRVRENLALTCPDLPEVEVKRLERAVPDNLGRMLAEIYSGEEFLARVRDLPIEGPGAEVLARAHAEGRPVVLAVGHFGNYDAWRGALVARGYRVGAIYRPMNNAAFNAQYVAAISAIAEPLFARSRRGLAEMMKYLRDGGMGHRGSGLGLPQEATATVGIGGQLGLEHLEGHRPVEAHVTGQVNHAHTALAQEFLDLVVFDPVADHAGSRAAVFVARDYSIAEGPLYG